MLQVKKLRELGRGITGYIRSHLWVSIMGSLMLLFLLVVLRLSQRLQGKASFHSKQKKNLREQYPDAHPLILRALVMIQEGYAGKINQRDMAENLGISPEYFSYLFSKNISTTFSAFLRDYRIERAKELYRAGSCDRKEVPYAVGFTDSKYYSQVFHKITGMTPSEYCQEYC